jgi:hypothetical protein
MVYPNGEHLRSSEEILNDQFKKHFSVLSPNSKDCKVIEKI